MSIMMFNNNYDSRAEIIDRLDAMRAQEEHLRCHNYFQQCDDDNAVDEACRKAMSTWIQQVQHTLSLSPETVWIGMSYLDRYCCSSPIALKSRFEFQLAAITAFYMAVKIYEPVVLGLDLLLEICRGTYTEDDIVSMEKNILVALNWRVSVHTPMDFIRHLLELIPELDKTRVSESLIETCQKHLEHAVGDLYFSSCRPSVVGVACLATSLADNCNDILSTFEKQAIWACLSELCNFNLSSAEIMEAQVCLSSLQSGRTLRSKQSVLSKQYNAVSKCYAVSSDAKSSSPVCVTQTARQA